MLARNVSAMFLGLMLFPAMARAQQAKQPATVATTAAQPTPPPPPQPAPAATTTSPPIVTPRTAGPAMTLDQALKLALNNNERALKTPLRVETAEGALDKARTAFYPTIIAQGVGAWTSTTDKLGRHIAENGNVTLNQPLLNLSAFPLYGQAKHALESERWGATEDLRVLLFDTANAFLTVLTAEQLLTAANQRYERAKSDEDDSAARASAQLASTNDVTRAHVESTTAQSQISQAKGTVERAYLALAYLVGQPIQGGLIAPDNTTTNAQHNAWQLEEVVRNAEARRPDVKSAYEHTESLRDFAKEPLYRLAPTLGLSGTIRAVLNPAPPDPSTTETVQLTLTWTIFDAAVRYADRRTRVAQAESGALDEKALRRSVATDIATAIAALRAARETYAISEDAVATATKNTDETGILYKQGLAKAIEVTDANASRYDAEVTRATAKLTMEQAYLNLRYALGLGPVADELPNPDSVKGGSQ